MIRREKRLAVIGLKRISSMVMIIGKDLLNEWTKLLS